MEYTLSEYLKICTIWRLKTKIVTNTDGEFLARLREIAANARAFIQEFTYERVVTNVSNRLSELALGIVQY